MVNLTCIMPEISTYRFELNGNIYLINVDESNDIESVTKVENGISQEILIDGNIITEEIHYFKSDGKIYLVSIYDLNDKLKRLVVYELNKTDNSCEFKYETLFSFYKILAFWVEYNNELNRIELKLDIQYYNNHLVQMFEELMIMYWDKDCFKTYEHISKNLRKEYDHVAV